MSVGTSLAGAHSACGVLRSALHALIPISIDCSAHNVRDPHLLSRLLDPHVCEVHLRAGLDLYSLHTSADYVIRYLDKVATRDHALRSTVQLVKCMHMASCTVWCEQAALRAEGLSAEMVEAALCRRSTRKQPNAPATATTASTSAPFAHCRNAVSNCPCTAAFERLVAVQHCRTQRQAQARRSCRALLVSNVLLMRSTSSTPCPHYLQVWRGRGELRIRPGHGRDALRQGCRQDAEGGAGKGVAHRMHVAAPVLQLGALLTAAG